MVDTGGHQRYDEPMYDDEGMRKMKYAKDGDDKDDTFGGPGSEVDKYLKSLRGKPGYDDKDDEGDIDIAKGKNYGGRGFGDDSDDGDKYEGDFEVDTDPKKYDGLESYEVSMAKRADKEIALHGKFRDGTSLPPGTDFRTKIDDLDEEEVEAFYDEVADKYAKKHDITMGVMDDNKNYFMDEEGMTMSDLVAGIKSSAEDIQKHYGDQITNMIRDPMEDIADTLSDTAESSKNANPFSMASYGNNMRQRRKSGFGRRQTFKGLTG